MSMSGCEGRKQQACDAFEHARDDIGEVMRAEMDTTCAQRADPENQRENADGSRAASCSCK